MKISGTPTLGNTLSVRGFPCRGGFTPPSCLCSGRLPRSVFWTPDAFAERAPFAHAQWLCRADCIRPRLRLAEFGIENYFRKSSNVGNPRTRAVAFKVACFAPPDSPTLEA